MKTKQEIEEKLKIYKQIKENSGIFTSELMTSIGAITALEWVLEDSEVENDKVKHQIQQLFNEDNKCNKYLYAYPPFTTEKQLNLIKWLAHKASNGLLINKHITDDGASMVFDNLGHESTLASSFVSFEECLAKLANNLWQDLTKEDKQQIKELLE